MFSEMSIGRRVQRSAHLNRSGLIGASGKLGPIQTLRVDVVVARLTRTEVSTLQTL